MLALGLGLAAFLLICLIVCACTYRNAKARNRATRTQPQTRNLIPQEIERGEYIGLGLGLPDHSPTIILKDHDKETKIDEHAPPAYTPKLSLSPATSSRRSQQPPSNFTLASSPSPLLSLTPSPALAASVSPALSSYTLSPALSQGEGEQVGLLGGRRALTPPPPTYVR
jgi:hypothetical protein